MSVEQNITVVSRLMEEVINQAQVHILDEVMALAYLEHAGLMKGKSIAREDLKQIIWHFRSAFPVWLETIEYLIAQDDLVFRRVLCHGTNTVRHTGRPSTGKSVIIVCCDVFRIEESEIVEHWGFDWVGMMKQLTPTPVVA